MGRKPFWKTFQITSRDDFGLLRSAWKSSTKAFGEGKVMDFAEGIGDIETNLSFNQLRTLFRHAGVRYPDGRIVTDTMTTEARVKEWEREDTEAYKRMRENK